MAKIDTTLRRQSFRTAFQKGAIAFGLTLATAGGWFAATRLQVRMALVIVLSAIHGVRSAKLRHLGIEGRTLRRPTLRPALVIVLLVAAS